MAAEIHVQIKPDGKVSIEVVGEEGPHCVDIAQFLEELGTVEVEEKTSDYYKSSNQGIGIRH